MFQPIIDAVNVGPITVAILSIAAMLAAVLVVIRGVRFVLGLIGGSAGGRTSSALGDRPARRLQETSALGLTYPTAIPPYRLTVLCRLARARGSR